MILHSIETASRTNSFSLVLWRWLVKSPWFIASILCHLLNVQVFFKPPASMNTSDLHLSVQIRSQVSGSSIEKKTFFFWIKSVFPFNRPYKREFRLVNAYHSPRSRPKPLRFTPPHGSWLKVGCEQLIHMIPVWNACKFQF